MARILYEGACLLDTAAIVALFDEADPLHETANGLFGPRRTDLVWYAVDTTSHESYTRVRYNATLAKAIADFEFLRGPAVRVVPFRAEDETRALAMLRKYQDQRLSFQDALCAAVMLRIGIYKIFTFDRDFSTMGFWVIPSISR